MHLVNWDNVTCPKCEGDLSLRKVRSLNISMLGKLIVKLHGQSSKLRARVMLDKYGCGRYFLTLEQLQCSSNTWKAILNANKFIGFGFKVHVGNGTLSF